MSEWKSIATAPLNPEGKHYGPWLLVWCKNDHAVRAARWAARIVGGGTMPSKITMGWESVDGADVSSKDPTHWMPYPLRPPADKGVEQ